LKTIYNKYINNKKRLSNLDNFISSINIKLIIFKMLYFIKYYLCSQLKNNQQQLQEMMINQSIIEKKNIDKIQKFKNDEMEKQQKMINERNEVGQIFSINSNY